MIFASYFITNNKPSIMDYIKDLLCYTIHCPKRAWQIACYCGLNGFACNGYCYRLRCADARGDYDCDIFAQLCTGCLYWICAIPFASKCVSCCDFGKINLLEHYNSNTKTLSFHDGIYDLTLSVGDIPADTEIIDFNQIFNLRINSKMLFCFNKNIFPSSVKQILNFDCDNALEDILLPGRKSVLNCIKIY